MSDNVRSFIQNVAADDKIAASDSFVDAMREKIGAALDSKRIEVAQHMVSPGVQSEDIPTDSE